MNASNDKLVGTIGGSVLAFMSIPFTSILTTMVLAIVGSTVSYFTSMLLKYLVHRYKERKATKR
jgi:ABC-type Fe3+ transport system permease subunit